MTESEILTKIRLICIRILVLLYIFTERLCSILCKIGGFLNGTERQRG